MLGLYCGRLFDVKKIEISVGSNDSREACDVLHCIAASVGVEIRALVSVVSVESLTAV